MKNGLSWVQGTSTLDAFGVKFPVRCQVRTIEAGTRLRDSKDDVVYNVPLEGRKAYPCMPVVFPIGYFKITGIHERAKTNPYLYPFFISTDATALVPIWDLTEEGYYYQDSGRKTVATSFGLHASNSRSSLGCICVGPVINKEEDTVFIRELVTLLRPKLEKGPVYLEVYGKQQF